MSPYKWCQATKTNYPYSEQWEENEGDNYLLYYVHSSVTLLGVYLKAINVKERIQQPGISTVGGMF